MLRRTSQRSICTALSPCTQTECRRRWAGWQTLLRGLSRSGSFSREKAEVWSDVCEVVSTASIVTRMHDNCVQSVHCAGSLARL